MAEFEFDKEHTNWMHSDESPSASDLDRLESEEPEDSGE